MVRAHVLTTFLLLTVAPGVYAAGWQAGTARRNITPDEPMWMSGYAGRTAPAKEKEHDLWVKAVALQDEKGSRVVLVTADLCGVTREISAEVAAGVKKLTGLARERLIVCVSHTHCGPVVAGNLEDMYDMPPAEAKKIAPYTRKLVAWMTEAAVEAQKNLAPCEASVGTGKATFAVNRRKPTDKGVINDANPGGPVDHDVPVLRLTAKGRDVALVFGYACHNTTMPYYKWSGDYAGFAQIDVEKARPGCTALFWTGCGADANPLPRGKIELCRKYGKELADAVLKVADAKMTPLTGSLKATYAEVALDYGTLPTAAEVAAEALSKSHAHRKRAEKLQAQLKARGKIDPSYPHYPVQMWRLGDQVKWVALGGEVVGDYGRRVKKELGGDVWVMGYANDVCAYIPSERVLKEGGYEADSSQVYYGRPGKWAAGIEAKIVVAVKAAGR